MKKNLEDAIDRWKNKKQEKEIRHVSIQESKPSIGEFEIDIKLSHQTIDQGPGDSSSVSARMKTTTQSVAGEIIPDADVLIFEQTVNKLENDFYRKGPIDHRPAKQARPEDITIVHGATGE